MAGWSRGERREEREEELETAQIKRTKLAFLDREKSLLIAHIKTEGGNIDLRTADSLPITRNTKFASARPP